MLQTFTVMGDSTYAAFIDYHCDGEVCHPLSTQALAGFKALQYQLNRAMAAYGSTAFLVVDGDIGQRTADVVRQLAALARDHVPTTIITDVVTGEMRQALDLASTEMVAKFADALTRYMKVVAAEASVRLAPDAGLRVREYELTANRPAPTPGPSPGAPGPTTTPPAPAPTSSGGRRAARWPWVVAAIGTTTAIGLTVAGVAVSRRGKRRRRRS
jgi:hypothetical protein